MVQRTEIHNLDGQTILSKFKDIEEKLNALSKKESSEENNILTRKDLVRLLKISMPTVHNWVNSGIITAYKIGNQTRFKKDEILKALKKANKI